MADADAYEDTGASDPCENNDFVRRWIDQSPNAHVASGFAGDGNAPVFLTNIQNGLPVVECAVVSTSRYFTVPDHATLELDTDSTVMMVIHYVNLSGFAVSTVIEKYANSSNSGAGAYSLYIDTSRKPQVNRPNIENGVVGTNGYPSGGFAVITARVSGTSVSHFLDGAANGTDTLATGTATNFELWLCRPIGGAGMRVGEILIYNAALSDADREAAEDYLGTKWGITITH